MPDQVWRLYFGDKYVIDSLLEYKEMSAIVRFCWIIEIGTDFPRLTSCYVEVRGKRNG